MLSLFVSKRGCCIVKKNLSLVIILLLYQDCFLKGGKPVENLKGSYVTNYKNVIVKISDGSMIKGKVNIRETHKRLSDFFRLSEEQFLTVISEETKEDSQNVFFVNKDYIVWIGPGD
jgi:hypothetical protein